MRRGYEVIRTGGDGPAAVEAAITLLEDAPLFNAGKGAVFTTDATNIGVRVHEDEADTPVLEGAQEQLGARGISLTLVSFARG